MAEAPAPILITGGAQRLGRAAAMALHESVGPVVVTYRKERPDLQALRDRGIVTLQADFDGAPGTHAFIRSLKSRYRALRAIIHNASEWLREGDELTDASVLQRMLDVHVTAPYLINQDCGEMLVRHARINGCADIIHMTDYITSTGSAKHIAYAASKAALENLTLSFAAKYAPSIKVNSIAPALLMFNPHDDAVYREKARDKALLSIAPGEAEGINAIRYLLDSRYLTGKTIALDGGRHLARAS